MSKSKNLLCEHLYKIITKAQNIRKTLGLGVPRLLDFMEQLKWELIWGCQHFILPRILKPTNTTNNSIS